VRKNNFYSTNALCYSFAQDGEAGGITQQIGATNVPIEVIREQCKMVKNVSGLSLPIKKVTDFYQISA
jgi:translation initiation factor IF-2